MRSSLAASVGLWMALLVGVAGCGASDPTDSGVDAAAPSDSGPFDSGLDPDADLALVGTWSGSVAGSLGSTEIIAELLDDGSFTTRSASNPIYCALSGTWRVAGADVRFEGQEDGCERTEVSPRLEFLSAPWGAGP